MTEVYKCVIKPNRKRIPDKGRTYTIPVKPGTPIIEAFSINRDGSQTVHHTLISGVGIVEGKIR